MDLGDGLTATSVNGQTRIITGGEILGTPVHEALANYRLTGDERYFEKALELSGDGLLSRRAFELAVRDVFDDTGMVRSAMEAYAMEGPSAAVAGAIIIGKFKINSRSFHRDIKPKILKDAAPQNYRRLKGTLLDS